MTNKNEGSFNPDDTPEKDDSFNPDDTPEKDDSYLDEFGSPAEVTGDYPDDVDPEGYSPNYDDEWDLESTLEETEFDDTVFDPNVASFNDDDHQNVFEDGDAFGGGYYDSYDADEDEDAGFSPLAITSMVIAGLLVAGLLVGAAWKYFSSNNEDAENTNNDTTISSTVSSTNALSPSGAGGTSPALPPGVARTGDDGDGENSTSSTSSSNSEDDLKLAREEVSRLRKANSSLTSALESVANDKDRNRTVTKTRTETKNGEARTVTKTERPQARTQKVTVTERPQARTVTASPATVTQTQVRTQVETQNQQPRTITNVVTETETRTITNRVETTVYQRIR